MHRLDLDFVRDCFPAFRDPLTAQWAFFENAGGAYAPQPVVDRLLRFFQSTKVQPYGLFPASAAAGQAMDESYAFIADWLNADPAELTLGPSTSMNTYVLAQALRPLLSPGDEIIVTNQDHEANIGCWRRLAEIGAVIREWRIDPLSGELSVDDLASLAGKRTRLICFPLCSNIVGTFNDAAAISRIARDAGALTIADGVSYAPHQVIDPGRAELDFYLFSAYKTFATHIGIL